MGQKIKVLLLSVLILLSCVLTGGCSTSNPDSYKESLEKDLLVPKIYEDLYIYDQGEFLSDDQEEVINNLLVQLEDKTTIEFAVITVPSLNNLTVEQYAVRLANKLGIGKEDANNGILLLVSKTDAKVRLEIGVGLQEFLTDSISGEILDKYFVPSRDKGNYDDACFNTVNAVINEIAEYEKYENAGLDEVDQSVTVETEEELTAEDIFLIIIVLIVLLALEWITGAWLGNGFGDGIVFFILQILSSSSGGGSGRSGRSGGSFGGGRSNGGGASR